MYMLHDIDLCVPAFQTFSPAMFLWNWGFCTLSTSLWWQHRWTRPRRLLGKTSKSQQPEISRSCWQASNNPCWLHKPKEEEPPELQRDFPFAVCTAGNSSKGYFCALLYFDPRPIGRDSLCTKLGTSAVPSHQLAAVTFKNLIMHFAKNAKNQDSFEGNQPANCKSMLVLRWSEHFCFPSHLRTVVVLTLRNTEEAFRPPARFWHGGGNNSGGGTWNREEMEEMGPQRAFKVNIKSLVLVEGSSAVIPPVDIHCD